MWCCVRFCAFAAATTQSRPNASTPAPKTQTNPKPNSRRERNSQKNSGWIHTVTRFITIQQGSSPTGKPNPNDCPWQSSKNRTRNRNHNQKKTSNGRGDSKNTTSHRHCRFIHLDLTISTVIDDPGQSRHTVVNSYTRTISLFPLSRRLH